MRFSLLLLFSLLTFSDCVIQNNNSYTSSTTTTQTETTTYFTTTTFAKIESTSTTEPKTDIILPNLNNITKMKVPNIIHALTYKRAKIVVARVLPYIKHSKRILDIGCGTGHVADLLTKEGRDLTLVDISDKSWVSTIKPIIYDGKRSPLPDKSFDTLLLLMVLHIPRSKNSVFRNRKGWERSCCYRNSL